MTLDFPATSIFFETLLSFKAWETALFNPSDFIPRIYVRSVNWTSLIQD